MRNTKQRNLVLSIVNASCYHPTALDIYHECLKVIPNISLGTVYRNLNALIEQGKIRRLKINNIDKYDKIDEHCHFICIKCGKIIDIYKHLIEYIDEVDGNKVLDCKINFEGICKDCLKEEESVNNGIKRQ